LQTDVLDHAKQANYFPGIETWISYIAKLYNEEVHILARRDVKGVADLANQKVNVDLRGAGTAITASRLFDLLKITVTATYDDQEVALGKLRKGEIAALAFVAGKPAPLFCNIAAEEGLHFLAVPLNPAITAAYVPTRLSAQDYPGLVPADRPVDTVAIGTVLAAANLQYGSERYRNLVNFVDAFFTGFQLLLDPGHHPKWQEVNLMAELPGWRRFPPAEQWLQRNAPVAAAPNLPDLKAIFSRFIDERQRATGGPPMTQQERISFSDSSSSGTEVRSAAAADNTTVFLAFDGRLHINTPLTDTAIGGDAHGAAADRDRPYCLSRRSRCAVH
jgi:hypothetical protein